jgi:hypothetical protein
MARKEREREREKGAKGWSPNSPFKAWSQCSNFHLLGPISWKFHISKYCHRLGTKPSTHGSLPSSTVPHQCNSWVSELSGFPLSSCLSLVFLLLVSYLLNQLLLLFLNYSFTILHHFFKLIGFSPVWDKPKLITNLQSLLCLDSSPFPGSYPCFPLGHNPSSSGISDSASTQLYLFMFIYFGWTQV